MIKTITERSLHGVIQKMKAQGVSLKDTEGFGINVDSSGHTYVVFMAEEFETGVIDTSAGEAGVSAWINPGNTNPATGSYVEVGEVKTSVEYSDTESLTYSSGNTWAATLSGASGTSYIKPRTFKIQATGNGPELADDGLGLIRTTDNDRRSLGTIDYETGEVSVTYSGNNEAPGASANVYVQYDHSQLPNSSVFPKVAAITHIVFVGGNSATTFALYNNNPDEASSPYQAPAVFGTSSAPVRVHSSGDHMSDFFCDSRVSICLNTDIDARQVRWLEFSCSSVVKAVYVYWNRLSS